MVFDPFSLIALDMQIWASFGPILESSQNERLGMSRDITI